MTADHACGTTTVPGVGIGSLGVDGSMGSAGVAGDELSALVGPVSATATALFGPVDPRRFLVGGRVSADEFF